jgi:hypothetical protein
VLPRSSTFKIPHLITKHDGGRSMTRLWIEGAIRSRSLRWKAMAERIVYLFIVRKKYCSDWKNKLKSMDYKTSEQSLSIAFDPCFLWCTTSSPNFIRSLLLWCFSDLPDALNLTCGQSHRAPGFAEALSSCPREVVLATPGTGSRLGHDVTWQGWACDYRKSAPGPQVSLICMWPRP